jgi:hypothetical protein
MPELKPPDPVLLLAGVILSPDAPLEDAESRLAREFGPVELRSQTYPFDYTDYYREEMGPDLARVFFAFSRLVDPSSLRGIKLATAAIEDGLSSGGRRTVNIDPGYVDLYKLVLASFKPMGHKIYLGKGVYADPTLYYDKGWRPHEWGFPDFRSGLYDEYLEEARRAYREKLKETI